MFVNSYLDAIGKVLKGEFDLIVELTKPEKIYEIFSKDCEKIIASYKKGEIDREIAKRNFFLLKSYVVSQLGIHVGRLKSLANEKGIEISYEIEEGFINEVAMMIDEKEKEL
ncbi:MAG: hypothetical protein QXK70_00175 [Archaeoglobaceae archaeon]